MDWPSVDDNSVSRSNRRAHDVRTCHGGICTLVRWSHNARSKHNPRGPETGDNSIKLREIRVTGNDAAVLSIPGSGTRGVVGRMP